MGSMKTQHTSTLALALALNEAGAAPSSIELVPAGTFSGRDGRGPYTLDVKAVLAAFAKNAIDLPIDYEHQSMSATDKTGPVPAAGWITALEARAGALWGQVRWTARAAEMVSALEYRFISPVFHHDKQGRVLALAGAGLTHYPNLDLNPVAHTEGVVMPEFLDQLRTLLKLDAEAADEAILAAITALMKGDGKDKDTDTDTGVTANTVALKDFQAMALEFDALKNKVAQETAKAAVEAAMHSGKLVPAMQPWALTFAAKDAAGFAQWVTAAPVIVSAQSVLQAQHVASNVNTLTDEEHQVCHALGLRPEDFAAHKKVLTDA